MDGFILRQFLIELIGVFDWAVFHAGSTTRAFALNNIFGLLSQSDLKVSRLPCNTVNLSIGQDLDIGMPVGLDQLGREYSHGAIIGGKGLVELGHMAANARRFLDQVNLKTGSGKIKRGLDTADPSPHNHNISKIIAGETFKNLFFKHFQFFFHFCPSSYDRLI